MVDHGNGNYEGIAGEGALYDAVSRDGSDFVLEEPVQENLRLVQGAAIGKQQIYGLVSNLELYSRNVPYEDTQWALCGFVTEDSVYGLISDVYERILGAILGSALMAVYSGLFSCPVCDGTGLPSGGECTRRSEGNSRFSGVRYSGA